MDRRSPQAIQYSIKILQEYECWGLCGEVKKFMGAWKYDQTDIERQSLIIPLHEQRSGAVHGYPITASDKRQTPAVTNCRSIFVYRKPRQLLERLRDDIVNIALHISLKNFEQQCNGINAHSTTLRGYLFHCGGRYACLIRVISAEFLSRGILPIDGHPPVIPIAHVLSQEAREYQPFLLLYDMYQAFQGRLNKKYGKELEFVHSPEVLDEQSSALLELTFSIFMTFKEGADRKRRFLIYGQDAVRFFQIVRESGVNYGRSHFDVKFSDPEISFDIAKTDTGRYFLRPVGKIEIFNAEQNFCIIIDSDKKQIYVCGREFTNAVGALLYAALKEELLISEKEIAAFYTAVIRPVSKYVKFSGLEVLSDFTPP